MHIRKKTVIDYEAAYSVVRRAFKSAEHADGNEQNLMSTLRKGDAFIPKLSLATEADGKIIGHIMFTRATVDGKPILALAPLSVLPEYQRKGTGEALIQGGHKTTKGLGYTHAIVLGNEKYYLKSGHSPAKGSGINAPSGAPSESFMTCVLNEAGAEIHGTIKYAPEFGIEWYHLPQSGVWYK